MIGRLVGDRRSFLKGVGSGGVVGVGIVGLAGFEGIGLSSQPASTLTIRSQADETNYSIRLSDPDARVVDAPSDTVVSHKNGKTFFAGVIDAGVTATFGFDGGVERVDLASGAASVTVDDPKDSFTGGISAEGHGLYRVVATGPIAKSRDTETEDATMFSTLQGTVDDDADYYEAEGGIRHADLRVAQGEELSIAHSFVEE
ncbi:MAG: twin-arginine translocation signal domain-containing protein [Halolamina sp.]